MFSKMKTRHPAGRVDYAKSSFDDKLFLQIVANFDSHGFKYPQLNTFSHAIDQGDSLGFDERFQGAADAIERIRKNLILNSNTDQSKAYLICSALRFEGVSTLACLLARSLARSRKEPVLIVDANMRFPSIHKQFKLPLEGGLLDVVNGKLDPQASIKKTGIENLFVVTNGRPSTSVESIFETKKFIDCLSFWRTKHHFLIFDSSPILPYPDSLGLASILDGVILVVEFERTRREVVLKAKETLQAVSAPIVGVVINRIRHYIPDFLYRRLT